MCFCLLDSWADFQPWLRASMLAQLAHDCACSAQAVFLPGWCSLWVAPGSFGLLVNSAAVYVLSHYHRCWRLPLHFFSWACTQAAPAYCKLTKAVPAQSLVSAGDSRSTGSNGFGAVDWPVSGGLQLLLLCCFSPFLHIDSAVSSWSLGQFVSFAAVNLQCGTSAFCCCCRHGFLGIL